MTLICESCGQDIPHNGVVCVECDRPADPRAASFGSISHRAVSATVSHLKGLVLLSVMFGIFVAPFAVWIASRALHEHRESLASDPATARQLRLLRRIAAGLLIFWAFLLGAQISAWTGR